MDLKFEPFFGEKKKKMERMELRSVIPIVHFFHVSKLHGIIFFQSALSRGFKNLKYIYNGEQLNKTCSGERASI